MLQLGQQKRATDIDIESSRREPSPIGPLAPVAAIIVSLAPPLSLL